MNDREKFFGEKPDTTICKDEKVNVGRKAAVAVTEGVFGASAPRRERCPEWSDSSHPATTTTMSGGSDRTELFSQSSRGDAGC